MAHEIRVLEDQLYDADYHNRVLIDKLEQVRLKSEPARKSGSSGAASRETIPRRSPPMQPSASGQSVPEPIRDPLPDFPSGSMAPSSGGTTPSADLLPDDLGSIVDEGQPASPADVSVPGTTDPFSDDPNEKVSPAEKENSPAIGEDAFGQDVMDQLLPAPGGPQPPSKRDTELPPVLPGEVLPPSILDGEEDKPPGQILLPDSVQEGAGVPDQLRLHPSLSGAQRVDGKLENMLIVINVLNEHGRPLDLTEFNVEAVLSVVLFEADQDETEAARIGRWDFSSDQVQAMIKSDPINGLHVPIAWQGRQPEGSEIVVHVRLRAEEDEMRCEGRLKVERANAVAEWTPRGEMLK